MILSQIKGTNAIIAPLTYFITLRQHNCYGRTLTLGVVVGVKMDSHLPLFGLFGRQTPTTFNLKGHEKWLRNSDFYDYIKNFKVIYIYIYIYNNSV